MRTDVTRQQGPTQAVPVSAAPSPAPAVPAAALSAPVPAPVLAGCAGFASADPEVAPNGGLENVRVRAGAGTTTVNDRLRAVARGPEPPEAGGDRPVVRRILQSRKQLELDAGEAKGNFGLFHRQANFAKILADLDAYHALLDIPIVPGNYVALAARVTDAHATLLASCAAYAGSAEPAKDAATPRPDRVRRLAERARIEADIVREIAPQADWQVGQTWRGLLPTTGGAAGGLEVRGAATTRAPDPGLPGTVSADSTMVENVEEGVESGTRTPLAAGAALILHEQKGSYTRVEAYTSTPGVISTLEITHRGFLRTAHVKRGSTKHVMKDRSFPIFTHDPVIDDINQGAIGDCYLLAALGALVAADPVAVFRMIRDNGDQTVTVKLYPPGDLEAPTLRYVTVAKSVVSDAQSSSGPLWVALIEKAYATLGMPAGKHSSSYVGLGNGGFADAAFATLTGKMSRERVVTFKSRAPHGLPTYWVRAADVEPSATPACAELYGGDAELTRQFFALVERPDMIARLTGFTTYEEWASWCEEVAMPAPVSAPLLARIGTELPSARGSNRYTPRQLELYTDVTAALAARKLVAATTHAQPPLERAGAHGVAPSGEPVAEGMVGSHVYTVLATEGIAVAGKPERKFLKLRNPWGAESAASGRGRVYRDRAADALDVVTDLAELEALGKPEFDMELTDFTRCFTRVDHT
ncbi:C2 family cysteine protease [Nocardioides sp. W7]|uniref:C2 family cysteine protease n=1 Tax=Nocardioides sp. W7 TaxID=2931390 RepID=UPI001FD48813|nr:C2 family cysteine protease [Nocardioides sp. W7]